jgi:hypothetical protein
MNQTLVIEIPEKLQQQLLAKANTLNVSLETLVLQSLTELASSPPARNKAEDFDPILPLLGTLKTEVNDVAENHDKYIGEALLKEIESGE